MRVLLTGAYGNVGRAALEDLVAAGHQVTCFDLGNRANRKAARRYRERARSVWGDLRSPEDVAQAVRDQDVVVHLAFIIPKLSATGVESEERPDWARAINVGGTRNLVEAIESQPNPPRLIFSSSCHVYGRTQHLPPPRTVDDPPQPLEHYARHKVECEEMIRASELEWLIFRFAAVLPLGLRADTGMFDVPLDNRMEYVHVRDVATAIAHAIENKAVWGRTLLIGGGPRCQYRFREIAERCLGAMGVGILPEEAFSRVPFGTDWLDTTESERLLHYQQRDLGDYVREMRTHLGFRRHLVRAFRPLVRLWLVYQSPYWREATRKGWSTAFRLAFGWWG